jgi:hypothetical protein
MSNKGFLSSVELSQDKEERKYAIMQVDKQNKTVNKKTSCKYL